ncbi:MAG TPA: ROK family protein [Chthoniobacterales bacterium]|jgi:predicted NBD/HSP70 family sugar kinase
MNQPLWGIDLGGTKIEGAILHSAHSADYSSRLRVPTEADQGYDHILSQIAKLVGEMKADSGLTPSAIGVGTPGVIDPKTGLLKNSNTLCLNQRPVRDDLSRLLGVSVKMANDANCFALAEATLGAAKGSYCVFGMILGTGAGGGVVVNEHALVGRHGIAGEWGHNVLEPDGAPCYCGKRGCVETVISGTGLQRYYAEISGQPLKLPEIVRRAATGEDAHAVATVERLKHHFAKGLAVIINILDPDAIVIGGGVGNLDLLYTDEVRAEIVKYLFNSSIETPILKPTLGDSAGVFGAALLLA